MNKDLEEILLKLNALRPAAGQLVFFDSIYGTTMIEVRKAIIEFKKRKPEIEEIDFVLFSGGGLADDAYRIIRNLRKSFKVVNVIVPFWAKSAATLLSLGATRIITDEFGEFGPLDAQIAKARDDSPELERESALNDEHSVSIIENRYKTMYEQMFIRLYEHKDINISKTELSEQLLKNLSRFFKPILSQINPYKLGEKKRILDIGAQYANRILLQFGQDRDRTKMRLLVDYLIHQCPDHGYVIDKDVLEKFVSNVFSSDIFGSDYADALQELSLYLMTTNDEPTFIGFVEQAQEVEKGDASVTETGEIVLESKSTTDELNTTDILNATNGHT